MVASRQLWSSGAPSASRRSRRSGCARAAPAVMPAAPKRCVNAASPRISMKGTGEVASSGDEGSPGTRGAGRPGSSRRNRDRGGSRHARGTRALRVGAVLAGHWR